jgi:hypothetical protein
MAKYQAGIWRRAESSHGVNNESVAKASGGEIIIVMAKIYGIKRQ